MAGTVWMDNAKQAKNDEFYTLFADVNDEIEGYDKKQFYNKTIYLPCDNPDSSMFARYFKMNFDRFGLKRLIMTCYNKDSHGLFWIRENKQIKMGALNGHGDFRSSEVAKYWKLADIVITNPPFSLFRDFFDWLIHYNVDFIILGSLAAITDKNVFPYIKSGKVFHGYNQSDGGGRTFKTPTGKKNLAVRWYTTLKHDRKIDLPKLHTTEWNITNSKHKIIKEQGYPNYDNYYTAIEVPYIDAIPCDYNGIMGVPMTYFDWHNPDKYEILGLSLSSLKDNVPVKFNDMEHECFACILNGKTLFKRIFIRKRQQSVQTT